MTDDKPAEQIGFSLTGNVAVVTMAKPPHNLLDDTFIESLLNSFEDASKRGARAILLNSLSLIHI